MRLLPAAGCLLASSLLQVACGLRSRRESELPQCPLCSGGNVLRFNRVFAEEDWLKAVQEEGLDPRNVSLFGRLAPKIPRSEVQKFMELNHTKAYRYSFLGSALAKNGRSTAYAHASATVYHKRRKWMLDFVKKHFRSQDYLSIVDIPSDWVPLGSFDHSYTGGFVRAGAGEDPKSLLQIDDRPLLSPESGDEAEWWDKEEFYRVIAASKFTLCPGGDAAWSKRSFEVFAAGSMPVIKSRKEDWRPSESEQLHKSVLQAIIDKMHYVTVDDLPTTGYSQRLVDENWRTFVKYMTFMEGDNEIKGMTPCLCGDREALM